MNQQLSNLVNTLIAFKSYASSREFLALAMKFMSLVVNEKLTQNTLDLVSNLSKSVNECKNDQSSIAYVYSNAIYHIVKNEKNLFIFNKNEQSVESYCQNVSHARAIKKYANVVLCNENRAHKANHVESSSYSSMNASQHRYKH